MRCANCKSGPLDKYHVRYHLTHSPNADALRGVTLHREHIIQAPKWAWEILCLDCFKAADKLVLLFPTPTLEYTVYTYKIPSSSQPGKFYDVEIKYGSNESIEIVCQCAWATYHQGGNDKLCSHQRRAIDKHLELYPPPSSAVT